MNGVRTANSLYGLISAGDRIAVAVSGGKDSQTLIRLLARWRAHDPIHYDLLGIHVSMEGVLPGYVENEQALFHLFQSLKVPLVIRPLGLAPDEPLPITCYRCSWHRRKAVYMAAHQAGFTKIAVGHHADDIIETALMNLLYHGRLESMPPRRELFGGALTLVRPLALLEERKLTYYARAAEFDGQSACCAWADLSKRTQIRLLLHTMVKQAPRARVHIYRAVERAGNWRTDRLAVDEVEPARINPDATPGRRGNPQGSGR